MLSAEGLDKAYKNKSYKGDQVFTDDGMLGHEQRHLQNLFKAMEKIRDTLSKELGGNFNSGEADRRVNQLNLTNQNKVRAASNAEINHTSPEPKDGVPYPSLP